jgi:hypothetical protein
MLIGISGKKQVGKNTLADILTEELNKEFLNFKQKSFAANVKKILAILIGVSVESMENEDVKNMKLPDIWETYGLVRENSKRVLFFPSTLEEITLQQKFFKGSSIVNNHMTIRQALQYIGTDLFRTHFNKDTWINSLFNNYNSHTSNWVITDIRFKNELECIKKHNGFSILISRDICNNKDTHSSEIGLDNNIDFNYTLVNNYETIEKLKIEVVEIIIPLIKTYFFKQ